jgi:hypothetical protein
MTDLQISRSDRTASRDMMEPRLRLKLELAFVTGQQMHVRVAVPCSVAGQEWGPGPYATLDEVRTALLAQIRVRDRWVLASSPDEPDRSAGFLCGDLVVNADKLLHAVITPA